MDTATTKPLILTEPVEAEFQTSQIMHISGAHFIHDTFTGFIPTTLPVLMEKLSLSLTMIGTLTAIMQLPAILNPLIGFYADRLSLQLFVILAPAVTGTIISLLGMANSTLALAVMLFITGISIACFHAPADDDRLTQTLVFFREAFHAWAECPGRSFAVNQQAPFSTVHDVLFYFRGVVGNVIDLVKTQISRFLVENIRKNLTDSVQDNLPVGKGHVDSALHSRKVVLTFRGVERSRCELPV